MQHNEEPGVRVDPVALDHPNLRRLARALIRLAQQEIQAQHETSALDSAPGSPSVSDRDRSEHAERLADDQEAA